MIDLKPCDGCTACCKTVAVSSINKPMGEWCQHCDGGCQIFGTDERPPECETWQCAWSNPTLDKIGMNRPDRMRMVPQLIEHPKGESTMVFQMLDDDRSPNRSVLKRARRFGFNVLVTGRTGEELLYMPSLGARKLHQGVRGG